MLRVVVLFACLSLTLARAQEASVAAPASQTLELSLRGDRARLDPGAQVLEGDVRLEVRAPGGEPLLVLRAAEARRTATEVLLTGDVSLAVPEGAPDRAQEGGLADLARLGGLSLEQADVRAARVRILPAARVLELEGLRATARGAQGPAALSAERARLGLGAEGRWQVEVTAPRVVLEVAPPPR